MTTDQTCLIYLINMIIQYIQTKTQCFMIIILNSPPNMNINTKHSQPKKALLDQVQINKEKADTQFSFMIDDTQVIFPYEPYSIQRDYMTSLIRSLNAQQNALLQSPTGTGKTLSLLCASLAWLKRRRETHKQQSPSTRIIYLTRTHAQIKQVIGELKKTCYQPKIVVSASRDHACCNKQLRSVFGKSKELECRKRIALQNGKKCDYARSEFAYPELIEKVTSKVRDLQQLVQFGQQEMFCPFYYGRKVKQTMDILFIPYNYLLDKTILDLYNISCKNAILIFDQGHNVLSTSEECNSYIMSTQILTTAIEQLSNLKQYMLKMNTNSKENNLGKITSYFGKNTAKKVIIDPQKAELKSNITSVESSIKHIKQLHQYLDSKSIDFFTSNNEIQQGVMFKFQKLATMLDACFSNDLFPKFQDYQTKYAQILSDMTYIPNWAFDAWILFIREVFQIKLKSSGYSVMDLNKTSDKFRVHLKMEGNNVIVNVMCLDPSQGFDNLKPHFPYNVIITSGTLTPLNTWQLQLKIPFPKPLACPHILRDEQILAGVICKGPTNQNLNFNFENRSNKSLYLQLGKMLLQLCKLIPNGIIILFSSYSLLQVCKREFNAHGLMSQFYQCKKIFFQQKNSVSFKQTLQSYSNACKQKKGAALFAVTKGKVSEGMDLSDDKCRGVILVGVPYPSIKDKRIQAKKEYLDSQKQIQLTGNQWYMAETLRSINQSIGRVIRNVYDYGSIFLIDQRFTNKQIMNNLSEWVRLRMQTFVDFKIVQKQTKQFFQSKSQRKSNVIIQNQTIMNIQKNTNLVKQEIIPKSKTQFSIKQLLFNKPIISNLGSILADGNISSKHVSISSSKKSISMVKQLEIPKKAFLKDEVQMQRKQQMVSKEFEGSSLLPGFIKQDLQKQIFSKTKLSSQDDKNKYRNEHFESTNSNNLKECSVCTMMKVLISNKACKHEICAQCWEIWLTNHLSCPICRQRVRKPYLKN